MELKIPPALVEALIVREREFNAALVSLTATIDAVYSDAGDYTPKPGEGSYACRERARRGIGPQRAQPCLSVNKGIACIAGGAEARTKKRPRRALICGPNKFRDLSNCPYANLASASSVFCGNDYRSRQNTQRHPYNHAAKQPAKPKHHISSP
jgi:hypothetical protein